MYNAEHTIEDLSEQLASLKVDHKQLSAEVLKLTVFSILGENNKTGGKYETTPFHINVLRLSITRARL